MSAVYQAQGSNVVFIWAAGDQRVVAVCDQAAEAVYLLNRARYLHDVKRRYTAAARLIAKAEQLSGFRWSKQEQTS